MPGESSRPSGVRCLVPAHHVRVTAETDSAARVVAHARSFTITVDAPPAAGGDDLGPLPNEYLLAAWCGCMNYVGHFVAREMGLVLNGLSFSAEGTIDPSRAFGRPSEERAGLSEIRLEIGVFSDADDATLAEWLRQVEARCPVLDTLAHGTATHVGIVRTE
jgi:uncharacterized OsmC-like protein